MNLEEEVKALRRLAARDRIEKPPIAKTVCSVTRMSRFGKSWAGDQSRVRTFPPGVIISGGEGLFMKNHGGSQQIIVEFTRDTRFCVKYKNGARVEYTVIIDGDRLSSFISRKLASATELFSLQIAVNNGAIKDISQSRIISLTAGNKLRWGKRKTFDELTSPQIKKVMSLVKDF